MTGQRMTGQGGNFLKGRINRAVFWLGLVVLVVVTIGLNLAFHSTRGLSEAMLVLISIPRLHDIGRSGWHVLWGIGVEVVVLGLGLALMPLGLFPLAAGVASLLILGLLILLGSLKGDPAANRFGEPPLPGLGAKKKTAA